MLQFGPETSKYKARVQYLAGDYAGLNEWLPKIRLVVPWESDEDWWQEELNQEAVLKLGQTELDVNDEEGAIEAL